MISANIIKDAPFGSFLGVWNRQSCWPQELPPEYLPWKTEEKESS